MVAFPSERVVAFDRNGWSPWAGIRNQQRQLSRRLLGHYAYYGIRGNFRALANVYYEVIREWRKWLDRRSGKRTMSWERFNRLLKVYPLPRPRIVHSV